MVSCGSKFVIFTSIKWQFIPWVLFSFAPCVSASPLLVDLSSRSQQNVSVCRNVCLPKRKMRPSENEENDQHQFPRYPPRRASPYPGSRQYYPLPFKLDLTTSATPWKGKFRLSPQECLTCSFYECVWCSLETTFKNAFSKEVLGLIEAAKFWAASGKENQCHSFWDKYFLFPHMPWVFWCSHKAYGHKITSSGCLGGSRINPPCPLQKASRLHHPEEWRTFGSTVSPVFFSLICRTAEPSSSLGSRR